MDNENLEGLSPPYHSLSPQPSCSRHFDSVEVNTIADNILKAINIVLMSINHTSIVNAIQRNLKNGNNKLSLQDLLPSDINHEINRKRSNSEDISGIDMKKSRGDANPSSPVLAGFLAGNPVNISNFSTVPLQLKSEESRDMNNAEWVVIDLCSPIETGPKPQIAPSSSRADERVGFADNDGPIFVIDTPPNNQTQLNLNKSVEIETVAKSASSGEDNKESFVGNRPIQINELPSSPNNQAQLNLSNLIGTVANPETATTSSRADKRVSFACNNINNGSIQINELPPNNQAQLNWRASNETVANPQIATTSSRADKRVSFAGNNSNNEPIQMNEPPPNNQARLNSSTSNETVANPQIATASSIADKRGSFAGNNGPIQVNEMLNNQAQLNLSRPNMGKKVCEEIYRKLRAIFPNIDREYLKNFCPVDWSPGMSHDVQFGGIVERVLANESSWVMDFTNLQDDVPTNVDDVYERLTGIFPNADPHYLRTAAEKLKSKNDVQTFVDEKLNTNDYPTREQYLAKMRVTEEQERYTNNFNVEQFLSLFPDPFKHFEDNKRRCIHNWIVLEFLKRQFCRVRMNTIHKEYRSCSYNMSLTAKNLRLSRDFICTPRRHNEIPTENISLLQEMAFVRHYDAIRKHMETVKQREEEEFNSMKAAGKLWTCQCCYDDECMPSKCSSCDNGHVFCNSCVITGTNSKLGDGETHIPCFMDCGSEFSISTLQKVLPPTKLSILLKKRQAAEVMAAGLEGLVCCPFCHFATIPPEGDKVFKCLNPECMKESCIQCKEPNHVPYTCGELTKKDTARKYIEEKMTQALTRVCYKCKKVFFKEEGCNKMLCPCGAKMCYICNQPVKDYSHFRGQGSTEMDKCPLWSDNIRLNAEIVRKVEENARKSFLIQDPTMNIDTTLLAPALPPRTSGPHRDLAATENLADVLAARVLNNDRAN